MPPAARISDLHTCPSHAGGPVLAGEPTVLIGFMSAARVGDQLTCAGPPDSVSEGEPTVLIGNMDAARLGDPTTHGGVIVKGCPTVMIGSASNLRTDKAFCEDCERKRKEREKNSKRQNGGSLRRPA